MNGIGGCTIEEAKDRLSYEEVQRWAAYRKKNGSLRTPQHIERGFAMLATLYVNSRRKRGSNPFSIFDFMPHEDEPGISLEDAKKTWH